MAEKTDLNVAPYFDDFDEDDNFKKILFRPGFSIQARELTQLQSNLQNQIEQQGNHIFRDGDMVIPGQISLAPQETLKLVTTFSGESIDPSQYFNATNPITITGETTGVTAKVIGFKVATTTEQPLLYISYERSGSDFETTVFADGENISANTTITHSTQQYTTGVESVATYTSEYTTTNGATAAQLASAEGPAARKGSAYRIESGVYYVRGFFVNNIAETLILDSYSTEYTGEVGFKVTEIIITPENETSLLDNATGSSNFAAKGAHRLKINLTLTSLAADSTADSNFIELMTIKDGKIQAKVNVTEYAALEDTFARRTFDESGDYTVRPFQFEMKESVTIDDNEGIYTAGGTTDDGNIANTDKLSLKVSPGKAYVRGYEIEKIAPTFKDINKARDTQGVDAGISTWEIGNFVRVDNLDKSSKKAFN